MGLMDTRSMGMSSASQERYLSCGTWTSGRNYTGCGSWYRADWDACPACGRPAPLTGRSQAHDNAGVSGRVRQEAA